MEGKVEIKADLTKTIQLLCEKLGMTATEIIPYYIRLCRMQAIGALVRGLLAILLPPFLFLIEIPIKTEGYGNFDIIESPEGWMALWLFLKVIIVCLFLAGGIITITTHFEEFFAPKGCAISKLLGQIKDLL